MKFLCFLSTILFFESVLSVSLPPYLKKCKKDDANLNECIKESTNNGFSEFIKGDPKYHIATLNPVQVPFIKLDIGDNLQINLTDVVVYGLKTAVINNVNFDLEKEEMHFDFHMNTANVQAVYSINGRILILPITGNGKVNVTFVSPDLHYYIKYNILEKNGKEYINPVNTTLSYTTERAHFYLSNLFNGDKKLGDDMNKFLDEHWKEVNEEIGKSIGLAVGEIITGFLKDFFHKVPFSQFFN